ncbi:MAG: 5'-methylthioadenosine/S-adenosylhomocysteine nucleosidase [Rhodomicrobium sp.]
MTNTPTGIIFGLNKERRPYLDRLAGLATHKFGGLELIEGELAGKRVVLAHAGIGKVNASIAATLLCDRFECDLIVFPGLAGGLAPGLEAGDLVVATELVQHDHGNWIDGKFQLTQPSPPPGLPKAGNGFLLSPAIEQIAREAALGLESRWPNGSFKIHFGRIISGDIFVLCAATRERLLQPHRALAVDMEGAAIAQVAERFGREYLIVRVLSDLAGVPHALDEPTKLARLDAGAEFVTAFMIARAKGCI